MASSHHPRPKLAHGFPLSRAAKHGTVAVSRHVQTRFRSGIGASHYGVHLLQTFIESNTNLSHQRAANYAYNTLVRASLTHVHTILANPIAFRIIFHVTQSRYTFGKKHEHLRPDNVESHPSRCWPVLTKFDKDLTSIHYSDTTAVAKSGQRKG